MRKIFSYILLCLLFTNCTGDNTFTLTKVESGNKILISNGIEIRLIGVDDIEENRSSLNKYLNNEILIYDQNIKPINKFYGSSIKALIYNLDGDCINELLKKEGSFISNSKEGVNDSMNPPNSIKNSILSLKDLFKKYNSAVFLITTSNGTNVYQGSGFFISPEGVGISNYHVFEGTNKGLEEIKLISGEKFKISKVIEANKEGDYIIFKIETISELNYFNIATALPEIGEEVFAIGNPKGLEHTLSKGIVSGYRGENNEVIQTTTEITNGSSGGPLLNMNGEVIGITTSGLGEANLNFAININNLPLENFIKKKSSELIGNNHKTSSLDFLPTSTTRQIIKHTYFTASYSEKDEQPEWVAYRITPKSIKSNVERTNDYREDPFVKTGSASPEDYSGSGYDMGHLAPAETMSQNMTSMSESFYLSNISPQKASFNRGIWKTLEGKVRYWASMSDSLFVVTGPILNNPIDRIGKNNVIVPRAFYKTLVAYRNGKARGIAFILPNEKSNKSIYSYAVSIDSVEVLTGIDFYYKLDKTIQDDLEAKKDLKRWISIK